MSSADSILEINLDIISSNYHILRTHCPYALVGASVKANSYGLGAAAVCPTLFAAGCRHFFVASCDEGIHLRHHLPDAANIYLLNGIFVASIAAVLQYNLIPVLNNIHQAALWQQQGHQLGTILPCLLHFDTGMNRLGIPYQEYQQFTPDVTHYSNLKVLGIMSHLSSSEEPGNIANTSQLNQFKELVKYFPTALKSLSNSSGIFLGQSYHFDLVRPGGAIYGLNPVPYLTKSPVSNPVKLTSPIIQLQHLPAGSKIGYNGTHTIGQPAVIATIPIGYADGYLRALSNRAIVYVNNQPAPIVGRISMDLINIDVSSIAPEDIFLGQQVEIIGSNSSIDQLANLGGTIGYELLTLLGNRYKRKYTSAV
jgi:alanine racemase